jgi:hypothetical protein
MFLASAAAALSACWGLAPPPSDTKGTDEGLTTYHSNPTNPPIVLRALSGQPIARGSTTPYSPERTCGGCHAVDVVTRGYHFQQGRTDATNQIVVSDTFNPAKPWLLSAGMYGKT